MASKKVKEIWQRLKIVNTWYFLGLFVICLIVGVVGVRQNNLKSIELRDAVIEADKQDGDVESALRDLREHMYSHMNASLSSSTLRQPIQLKYRYDRLLEASKGSSTDSQKVYADAQAYCEQRFGAGNLRDGRVPCVQQYIDEHSSQPEQAPEIPEALYKFDFVSPTWSPDLAGWSLLLAGIFLALFLIRFLTERWFKAQYKNL